LRDRPGEDPVLGSCMVSILLKGDQLTRQVAGYFSRFWCTNSDAEGGRNEMTR